MTDKVNQFISIPTVIIVISLIPVFLNANLMPAYANAELFLLIDNCSFLPTPVFILRWRQAKA